MPPWRGGSAEPPIVRPDRHAGDEPDHGGWHRRPPPARKARAQFNMRARHARPPAAGSARQCHLIRPNTRPGRAGPAARAAVVAGQPLDPGR